MTRAYQLGLDPITPVVRTCSMPMRLKLAMAVAVLFAIGCGATTYVCLDSSERAVVARGR